MNVCGGWWARELDREAGARFLPFALRTPRVASVHAVHFATFASLAARAAFQAGRLTGRAEKQRPGRGGLAAYQQAGLHQLVRLRAGQIER